MIRVLAVPHLVPSKTFWIPSILVGLDIRFVLMPHPRPFPENHISRLLLLGRLYLVSLHLRSFSSRLQVMRRKQGLVENCQGMQVGYIQSGSPQSGCSNPLVNSGILEGNYSCCIGDLHFYNPQITSKTMQRSADFLKIYKRLLTTTWFVHNCNGLPGVNQDYRQCNKWQSTIKGVS